MRNSLRDIFRISSPPPKRYRILQGKLKKLRLREYRLSSEDMQDGIKVVQLLTLNRGLRQRIIQSLTKPKTGQPIVSLRSCVVVACKSSKITKVVAFDFVKWSGVAEGEILLSQWYRMEVDE